MRWLLASAAEAANAQELYDLLQEYMNKAPNGDQAELDATAGAIGDAVSRVTGNDIVSERLAYELAH